MHRAAAAALLLALTQAAWGPREALKRHEAEHDAAHAKEAAGDVAHIRGGRGNKTRQCRRDKKDGR